MQKERIARADYSLKCALCTVCIFYVTCMHMHLAQNDHSPGRLKFPDNSMTFSTTLAALASILSYAVQTYLATIPV